ncbi:MAG: hypothetical protein IJ006_06560 [Lachnospiraceae bacterium]|nr:hypothetical protein [Lachnospiraceae bacterium]
MKRRIHGSMTVEAAFLYPYLLTIAFLLVKLTVGQYEAVNRQAVRLYDAVCSEERTETAKIVRFVDTAFDFFEE